ncbi:MAG: DUF3182 family protein [Comamonadaceae bacterium]|nr:MAG: DUF3182 family protein [Comamonadaceae bacterium]
MDDATLKGVCRLATRAAPAHEEASHAAVIQALATLLDQPVLPVMRREIQWEGAGMHTQGRVYVVPTDTLIAGGATDALNIRDATHLFGGLAPFPFVATKAITHPLVGPHAVAPLGWSEAFATQVEDAVLPGWSVFSAADAREACTQLLQAGPVRVKPVHGRAGRGQSVVRSVQALELTMADIDVDELAQCGLVLEAHLEDVVTFSVGHVQVGPHTAAYVGTQCLTEDNGGEWVYGGSTLHVVRGGFENLLTQNLSVDHRRAIEQACAYDAAATSSYPGLIASRRNYDMVTGRDAKGLAVSGVLEQSWRIGGASGAELAALLAFREDPGLNEIRASTVERYGGTHCPPVGAQVAFDGDDAECGPMIKYVTTERL